MENSHITIASTPKPKPKPSFLRHYGFGSGVAGVMYKEKMGINSKKFRSILLSIFIPSLLISCGKRDIHIFDEVIYLEPLKKELTESGINFIVSGNSIETYVKDREAYDQIVTKVINNNVVINIFKEKDAQQIIKSWDSSSFKYSKLTSNEGEYVFLFAKANCYLALKSLTHTKIPRSICN